MDYKLLTAALMAQSVAQTADDYGRERDRVMTEWPALARVFCDDLRAAFGGGGVGSVVTTPKRVMWSTPREVDELHSEDYHVANSDDFAAADEDEARWQESLRLHEEKMKAKQIRVNQDVAAAVEAEYARRHAINQHGSFLEDDLAYDDAE
jgi:hypothetical protein